MNATHILPQSCTCSIELVRLNAEIVRLRDELTRQEWNDMLGMYNQAGGLRAIDALPDGTYSVVFADVDHLKMLNTATGNHLQTNRYLKAGLRVRPGEIAIQYFGDEIVFVLTDCPALSDRRPEQRRGKTNPAAFTRRLTKQLASQRLTDQERAKLPSGVLSATFAWRSGVAKQDIRATIEILSKDVLAQKEART